MTLTHSIRIKASADELFALTQDYGRRLQWDCFLTKAELLNGATEAGLGVRALCTANNGMAMETEYVSFEPPRVAAVKMTNGPWFIAGFAGSWRFQPDGPDHTRVDFTYSVKAYPLWMGWMLDSLIARGFAQETVARLASLKRFVEESVDLQVSCKDSDHQINR